MLDGLRWRYRLSETRALLERERRMLIQGDVRGLRGMDQIRAKLAEKLHAMPDSALRANRDQVEEIRRLARRNKSLLEAYIEGARRAASRLAAMEEKRGALGAYRRDGGFESPAHERATTVRRA